MSILSTTTSHRESLQGEGSSLMVIPALFAHFADWRRDNHNRDILSKMIDRARSKV